MRHIKEHNTRAPLDYISLISLVKITEFSRYSPALCSAACRPMALFSEGASCYSQNADTVRSTRIRWSVSRVTLLENQ